ncbi:carboxymuconolactone decarboxylase family protein [Streptomyces natalensis]|uniref:Alkylhydroperoxidase n=1 Tax=Streptomyces natalensis ATCC 27448 TaxID=1240678 RepID=A0A0D7CN15_9ACTN|nr:carboxymuconolactone decarboxylase family protein [Streptomyces natalensis]KIZ17598.1 alkylhydroperoxidase [Streptomyces natalensis ATCC 27448]
MIERINLTDAFPAAYRQIRELRDMVEAAAESAGLDPKLLELVKIRASQINGCAFCLDLHIRDARRMGEDDRRLSLLAAWWETGLYTPQERAALALTEAVSKLSQVQDVPDEVYREATAHLTKEQYTAVVWSISVINAFNRLAVPSRKPLPARAT